MGAQKGRTYLLQAKVNDSWVTLGATRNVDKSITQALVDATTKDSEDWEEHLSMLKSMTFSVDGIHDPTKTLSFDDIEDYILAGTAFRIRYGQVDTAGAKLIEADVDIETYNESTPHDGIATWDASLKVNGAPEKVTAGS